MIGRELRISGDAWKILSIPRAESWKLFGEQRVKQTRTMGVNARADSCGI
jgi:hypothetical protein